MKLKPEERFIEIFRAAAFYLGRPCRRRAIVFLPTTEVGGTVIIGDRVWRGDDPLTLPTGPGAKRGVSP